MPFKDIEKRRENSRINGKKRRDKRLAEEGKKGYVYKLSDDTNYYYGSTINIKERMNKYKYGNKDCGGHDLDWSNIKFEIVEEVPYTERNEVRQKEQSYINLHKDDEKCLNKMRAFSTKEQQKKDRVKYNIQWRLDNPEKYEAQKKKAIASQVGVSVLCDCGCKVSKTHISRHIKTQKHINKINNK